jgi:hypothetical protein
MTTNSEVVREARFAVDGRQGLETLFRGRGDSSNSLVRFILTDRHLVMVTVDGLADLFISPTARAFVDSIRIRAITTGK